MEFTRPVTLLYVMTIKMTIARRLILVLTLVLVALLSVAGAGFWHLYAAQQRLEHVQHSVIPGMRELAGARDNIGDIRRLVFRELLSEDSAGRTVAEHAMAAADVHIDQHLTNYANVSLADAADRELLAADRSAFKVYQAAQQRYLDKCRSGDQAGAKAMIFDGGALYVPSQHLAAALDAHVAYNTQSIERLGAANDIAYRNAIGLLFAACTAALAIVAVMGLTLYRSITSGLTGIRATCAEVSESLDLTRLARTDRTDEIGDVSLAFNALLKRVAEVIAEVRRSASAVSVASKQIAAGNTELSSRTEEQAASLEQTAASMEELTTAVQQNALHAHEASKLASNASDMSDDGRRLVEGMLVSMSDISAGSNQIADITSIIEGIAFQTNILALNAAVEAARAGEEGRGFAVVAAEVRNLAQRSSAAAREIKDLIEASTTHVSVGSGQAADVQLATHKAREAVLHVCKLIDEISVASDEQGRGIEQINTAVGQMDQMTQQNAALVEEAAAAAQSLEAQAARLDAMTARFTVPVAA